MMRMAFYKAEYGAKYDKWISWATWGDYSHVELVFSDDLWFSSSPRDDGVRYRAIEFIPEHWDMIDLSVTPEEEATIRIWCDGKVGAGYDWWGVLHFYLRFLPQSKDKWFCSEIVLAALQNIGWFAGVKAWRVSPNRLFGMMGDV